MSTYISLDNLARYDLKAKARAESLYADASAACWQKTEEAGAVTCVPAPETPLEPVVEFLFKETLPSGTKGPENPSVIEGVESVKVMRRGKNLVPYPFYDTTKTAGGITWTDNGDGTVTANGTATANSFFWFYGTEAKVLVSGDQYTLSGCPSGGSSTTYYMRFGSGTNHDDAGNGATFTATEVDIDRSLCARIGSGTTVSNLTFKPQIELGSATTAFEPYAGADYSINLPSTFYGGTLDVASGKLTVTQFFYSFTGEETITVTDKGDGWKCFYYRRTDVLADNTSDQATETRKVCTHFPFVYNANQQSTHWYAQSGGNICLFSNQFADVDAFKAWLAAQKQNGTPVELTFNLANTYTIQLDPVMINALPALDKTSPRVNTVYTDALNVQVGYAEHPAYTEELINNAILALGGDI